MCRSRRWGLAPCVSMVVVALCLIAAAAVGGNPGRFHPGIPVDPSSAPRDGSEWAGASVESPADINVNELSAVAGYAFDQGVSWLSYPAKLGLTENGRRRTFYLSGASILFGSVRFPDTLVAGLWPGGYLFPSSYPRSSLRKRSSNPQSQYYDPAIPSDVEIYGTVSDTLQDTRWGWVDEISGMLVEPMGIEVHQTIRAWKAPLVARALFIDDWIINVSDRPIERGCVGVTFSPPPRRCREQRPCPPYYVFYNEQLWRIAEDAGPGDPPSQVAMYGLVRTVPGVVSGLDDTINLAWAAENDGEAQWTNGVFGHLNPAAVAGVRILRAPKGGRSSFNWTNSYWGCGPRQRRNTEGYPKETDWPRCDRSLYRMMTNGEIDYDQMFSAIDQSKEGWMPLFASHDSAVTIAKGVADEASIMLSVGPFADWIAPGDSVQFTYVVLIGQDFHTDPGNFINNFNPDDPSVYYNNLNFTDLITAAQWAGWFYDNPGVDTDGDGYKGEYVLTDCHQMICDTVYYTGDGVPDFKGPEPPPPPVVEIETYPTKLVVHWTGAATEYARDKHSRKLDWEGYRVWLAQDDTSRGFTLLAGWDREDYIRFSYREQFNDWKQSSPPFTIAEWQESVNDPDFDPKQYALPSVTRAYSDIAVDTVRTPDGRIIGVTRKPRLSYFAPQDANYENTYPSEGRTARNLIQQVGTMDTIIDGQLRQYGVYEFTMENLSQTQAFWVAVTALDYGDYRNHIDPEESTPAQNLQYFRAINSADVVVDSNFKVSVFPNPYKLLYKDWQGHWTSYHEQGYEIAEEAKFDERDRRMWFINLPDTALVQIYSLDGDLIREIRHPDAFLSHYNSAVGWDLISRNQQAVTSGIYIWKVTSRLGSQMGKLVIIK